MTSKPIIRRSIWDDWLDELVPEYKRVKGEDMTEEEKTTLLTQEEKKRYNYRKMEKETYKNLAPHFYYALYPEEDKTKIELRSEKVRNIIGQVPPVLLRYGIMIISLSLLMLVAISAFIPYQPGIDAEITVTHDNKGALHYSVNIPQSAIKHRWQFAEVTLGASSELPLPTRFRIESISDVVYLSGKNAWQTATLRPLNEASGNIVPEKPITLPAKIMLQKQSVMRWMAGKVKMK